MRKDGSCLACCFPRCRTHTRRYHLQRVCKDCEGYFYSKYGEHHYKQFIDYFLEHKERNGWGRTAIDPRTIPRAVLLKRQSAPPRMPGTEAKGHGNRGPVRGQPSQVHQPMLVPRSIHPVGSITPIIAHVDDSDDSDERGPTPKAQVKPVKSVEHITHRELTRRIILQRQETQQQAAQAKKSAPVSRQATAPRIPSSVLDKVDLSLALPPGEVFLSEVSNSPAWPAPLYIPSKRRVLPADPSLFAVGDDEDYDDHSSNEYGFSPSPVSSNGDDDAGGASVSSLSSSPSPSPKNMSNDAPDEPNVPEIVHMAQGRRREDKKPVVRNENVGDASIKKKRTNGAKDFRVPNIEYIDYDGNWVPRVTSPPKGKRRTRTPSPEAKPSSQKVIAANAAPAPLSISKSKTKAIKYLVQPRPDPNMPTGSSARVRDSPSHASVAVPPPKRLDGLLVTREGEGGKSTDGVFFEERGLPSKQYVQECRSATVAQATPILVHVPKRRYSMAVQTCFCDHSVKGSKNIENRCFSCRERDLIAQDMNTSWI
ncbi:hypothetical protein F4680DRAFT_414482 [Xylaria scruposa]|nr:hypothetical protein F4680DRAFT_414482 [Xylaria scruposa]